MSMKINQCEPTTIMNKAKEFESKHYNMEIYVYLHRLHAFKVFKVLLSFWVLESELIFAHDIPYEQVHEFY